MTTTSAPTRTDETTTDESPAEELPATFRSEEGGFVAIAHPHAATSDTTSERRRRRHHGSHTWRVEGPEDPPVIHAAGAAQSQEDAERLALEHRARLVAANETT
jgi:hypothetical protein